MRDSLARELLAKVTDWTAERLTKERLDLQLLSEYKYDEYQQFVPGMRFIESLALWLEQFKDSGKQEVAYNFVKQKLIFISTAELNHLIRMAYPDVIKPYLIPNVAKELGIDEFLIKKIVTNVKFKILKRKCLFLGLSDGARIDLFRRFSGVLNHEQVYPTYLISKDKANELKRELNTDLQEITGIPSSNEKYKIVFLMDDFSASGISYIREENPHEFEGKIKKFLEQVISKKEKETEKKNDDYEFLKELFDMPNLKICIILYIATKNALKRIKDISNELLKDSGISLDIFAIQELDDKLNLTETDLGDFIALMKKNYDDSILTKQYKKGKHEKPYLGFDECSLPLVLSHNCPNNSLPIIWHENNLKEIRALFPRLQRYKVIT